MNPLLTAGRTIYNENTLDYNTIWPWNSGIAAGTAYNPLRLQQHMPLFQVTGYIFSKHCYIDFAET